MVPPSLSRLTASSVGLALHTCIGGQQVKKHEDMVILICGDNLDALESHEYLHLVHDYITQDLDDEPMVDINQWEPWPPHQNNAPQIVQLPEELSVQASAVSNFLNSGSSSQSDMHGEVHETSLKPPLPSPNPRPQIRIVYKRRQ
ncbi:hypothetical protein GUJ93_ZPchr0011g28667 [Zizania palustris]|uniref:Uncharacterized protein n=1 Tax=Zizania palustris TaxID=103762 RepID=A0A8J5WH04_ZIZPA|nr:hypothetical protein GUJ93_ZPchr0011g28667 [Zizania palustris]